MQAVRIVSEGGFYAILVRRAEHAVVSGVGNGAIDHVVIPIDTESTVAVIAPLIVIRAAVKDIGGAYTVRAMLSLTAVASNRASALVGKAHATLAGEIRARLGLTARILVTDPTGAWARNRSAAAVIQVLATNVA